MAVERVVLDITYDPEKFLPPSTWDWHEILDVAPHEVRLVMSMAKAG